MHRCSLTLFLFFCSLVSRAQTGAAYDFSRTDSVTAIASHQYQPGSFLRKFLMGSNYRQQWQTPVTAPVFRLSGSQFTIMVLGGGMQTKSLQLRDAGGKVWSLRTIDKDVTDAMRGPLRNSVARRAMQDQISSILPYGALVVGKLASAAGISAAQPQLVLVAEDPALDGLNTFFAGKLCMLEERDPGFDSTFITDDILRTLQQSAVYRVDQKAYLKARLLDMLIADWDRHAGNWRWGLRDSAGLKWWVAVPRDRDWAFYQSKGLVPWLAQQTGTMRQLINFSSTPKKLTDQNLKAWALDRLFLNTLTWDDWTSSLQELQSSLNDPAIEKAVKILPPSIYQDIGLEMTQKLVSRRNALQAELIDYYHFQCADVLIEGTGEADAFLITTFNDSLKIEATANGRHVYRRTFLPTETYSITINARGGDDVFKINVVGDSPIRLQLSGGEGHNTYDLNGKMKLKLQDVQRQ